MGFDTVLLFACLLDAYLSLVLSAFLVLSSFVLSFSPLVLSSLILLFSPLVFFFCLVLFCSALALTSWFFSLFPLPLSLLFLF